MKRLLTLVTFLLFPLLAGTAQQKEGGEAKVYVCTGPSAITYHKSADCRALKTCSAEVKYVSFSQISAIRRPCRLCYGKPKRQQNAKQAKQSKQK